MKPSLKGKFERKWIPGYEGEYAVATNGIIWSYKRSLLGMPLKSNIKRKKNGQVKCYCTSLCRDGIKRDYGIGYLVLTVFVGPCPEGMECCHYDDVKENNKLENLRWDTRQENCRDALKNGKGSLQKLSVKDVLEIKNELKKGKTQQRIADMFGIGRRAIGDIKTGKTWSHI